MRSTFIVDPVEAGFHSKSGQHAVLGAVPIAGGDIHGPTLVVQGVCGVVTLLVPALGHPQSHPGPLVHHRDRQRVQLLLAPLKQKYKPIRFKEISEEYF